VAHYGIDSFCEEVGVGEESKNNRRVAGALGVMAAGLGMQAAQAAIHTTAIDAIVPEDDPDHTTNVVLDLDGDGFHEFDIRKFASISKVANIQPGVGLLRDGTTRTLNVPAGTLIDGSLAPYFGGKDDLNADTKDHLGGTDNGTPSGNFQVSDGPGYIAVQFQIFGDTHYGYVGYEGRPPENSNNGHVFAMAYEDQTNVGIVAGMTENGFAADANHDGRVDGKDFLAIQQGIGSTTGASDLSSFRAQYGLVGGAGVTGVPEPTGLAAGGAALAGLAAVRRKNRKKK
jgi:hypothetical protein